MERVRHLLELRGECVWNTEAVLLLDGGAVEITLLIPQILKNILGSAVVRGGIQQDEKRTSKRTSR